MLKNLLFKIINFPEIKQENWLKKKPRKKLIKFTRDAKKKRNGHGHFQAIKNAFCLLLSIFSMIHSENILIK